MERLGSNNTNGRIRGRFRRGKVLCVIAAFAIAVLILAVDFADLRFFAQRRERRAWHERELLSARSDLDQLLGLARLSYDYSEETPQWKRNSARAIVYALVRLPGEITSPEASFSSSRWDRVMTFLSTCPEAFVFDEGGGVWTITEVTETSCRDLR